MREIICGIYKITNQLNKKFYIGQSVDIHKRWLTHCRDTDDCPIHKAIQKYGKENFSLEILEKCSKEELNEKEIFWIKKYNGYESSNCYNATRGGEGASHPVKISQENLLNIINDLENTKIPITKLAKKYGVSTKTISDINLGNSRILENKQYPIRKKLYNKEDKEKYIPAYTKTGKEIQKYHSISIGQYDLFTNELIATYPSIREAGRIMKCNPESIRKALKSQTHKSVGFIWKEI